MAFVGREPGDEIGGYRVVEQLGRGGSGAVYKVVDGGGAEAALKLVDARADEVAAMRLEREVHALQALKHPAVPSIVDAELDGDETFVVFEYIPGESLWDFVQHHGPMRDGALAEFAARTASALEAVHATGVVHRDVTPSNIMMGPDGPVLIDFGLSHLTTDSRLTRDGLVSGTAGYVAPEVIDGDEPGIIADHWSWAATVAYAATAKAPFGSGTGAISKTLEGRVDLPSFTGAQAVAAALGRDVTARPEPRDVVAALRGETTVLPRVEEVAPTAVVAVAPTEVAGIAPTAVARIAPTEVWVTDAPTTVDDVAATHAGAWDDEPEEADDAWEDEAGDADEDGNDPWSDGDPAWDDPDAAGEDSPDFDSLLNSGEQPTTVPPAPRRRAVIGALALATASVAAIAPFVTFLFMALCAVTVRAFQRRALALAAARAKRGQRRGDAALQTIGLPWHIVRAAGEALPSILLAAVVGIGVGALGWWLVSAEVVASASADAQGWGHGIVLVVAGLAAVAVLWWGPWSGLTREGAHRVTAALTPSRGVSTAWVVVAVVVLAVMVLVVYLLTPPWWWPLPALPA